MQSRRRVVEDGDGHGGARGWRGGHGGRRARRGGGCEEEGGSVEGKIEKEESKRKRKEGSGVRGMS